MKTFTAVLHVKNKTPLTVAELSGKVSTSMAANKALFSAPEPALEVLDTETDMLHAVIDAKDGSKIKNLDVKRQADVVYNLLKSLIAYVNKVAQGDQKTILLSGFDCNNEPVSHDVPGKAVIKRVEDGSVPNSARIYLESLINADRYKVEITTTPDDVNSWTTVLDYGGRNKLEIRNLPTKVDVYIRVCGGNRRGWGVPSELTIFVPR